MNIKKIKKIWKKVWWFIWEDNSIWSWLVNIVLSFVLIKFIVYPVLGLLLGTGFPIVAVVSSSMEHNAGFDSWWADNSDWYENMDIDYDEFKDFRFRNGFNKGDIMILYGKKPNKVNVGDVIVFKSYRPDPIIHRVVNIWEDGGYHYHTKGDNKPNSIQSPYLD